jgi:hypothetical protein
MLLSGSAELRAATFFCEALTKASPGSSSQELVTARCGSVKLQLSWFAAALRDEGERSWTGLRVSTRHFGPREFDVSA